jgi:multicomponent Na+:H+ antiporter subunit F
VTAVVIGCLAVLLAATAAAAVRALLVRGLPDRAVALDAALALMVNALALLAVLRDDLYAVELILAATLLGAIGALTVARFVERRGS